jgi:uncharacterized protein (DUF302 family)
MMTLDYTKTTVAPHGLVVEAVQSAAAARNFRTLHVHRVDQTLAEKGFQIPAYSIIEVCNAAYAHAVITKHPPVGMMLPCRIVVYTEGERTVVTLMKPTLIADMMPGQDFGSIPSDVERILTEVVDEAAA